MRRRDFMALVGGAASWPAAAGAQQAGRLPTIGLLGSDPVAFAPWIAAFVARLRELGLIDGRTVAIEYQWSEGRTERYAEIAAGFVRQKVDVIVTVGSAVPTIRQATSVIPIVFAVAIDPVRSGLVSSLAKPGGNVTGLFSKRRILPENDWKSCANLSHAYVDWPSSSMAAMNRRCWK
jgi:putative ABC transport system substrate-binding protein